MKKTGLINRKEFEGVLGYLRDICKKHLNKYPKLSKMYSQGFLNTLETTTELLEDSTTYVFTGDIPAMWLRDSSAQVSQYLALCGKDENIRKLVAGMLKRQFKYIQIDPYANAFNKEADGRGHNDNTDKRSDWVWERKYEIDSLCYPVWIAYKYFKASGDNSVFDGDFAAAIKEILRVWKIEQRHDTDSDYRFIRLGPGHEMDNLRNGGKGMPTNYTGLLWSGFRPSDDVCELHYLIPSNQFAVVVLGYLQEIYNNIIQDDATLKIITELKSEIEFGIGHYGIVTHPVYGKIYAYETDGYGNHVLMDDANVPSLLSLPYLGYCSTNDEIYQNTRKFILSSDNPYYAAGKFAAGVGSPHTPAGYVWHIGLIMQGLTTDDKKEKAEILSMLLKTDAGTDYMHEAFDPENPENFTRPWFAWANSLFAIYINSLLPGIDEMMQGQD
ncbi:MAG: glycoside hydrolase family 125 protein [Oscillospiraceae bacterium]|nr:glycoside hydrolase family 125 protein [Oscillospiraceae bacterium]